MKFMDKFGLKPHKLSIEIGDSTEYFYCKHISYNLAVTLANLPYDTLRQLVIIRHCLCEEDGSMVFHEDTDLAIIGDALPFEVISTISTKIAKLSGPQSRSENLKKKPEN